jgi:hypothetical protein
MLRSNNSFVSSDQNGGAKDLIISSFWGLALQHWAPCILPIRQNTYRSTQLTVTLWLIFYLEGLHSTAHVILQVVAASELALSVLPHAGALNPNEIMRAIHQCKEQSNTMLEKACLAVEKAATGGGVYPEVMFEVARHWYHLFEKHAPAASNDSTEDDQPLQPDHVIIFLPHCTILRMLLA